MHAPYYTVANILDTNAKAIVVQKELLKHSELLVKHFNANR